jgi:hypothetical protein
MVALVAVDRTYMARLLLLVQDFGVPVIRIIVAGHRALVPRLDTIPVVEAALLSMHSRRCLCCHSRSTVITEEVVDINSICVPRVPAT